jgi:hypothetical protein
MNKTISYPHAKQLRLPLSTPKALVNHLAEKEPEERGAVFTRREVVEFILDLAGYTSDKLLFKFRLLEPSFGEGDFLLPVVERLLAAHDREFSDPSKESVAELSMAIRAVEVHRESIKSTQSKLLRLLIKHGFSQSVAQQLIGDWIIEGDYLLVELPQNFTHTVGNPPYVRQELIPDVLIHEYRARYKTIYDRADLYVPFIERSLENLAKGGTLAFICSDRWMKNKYGGPLRAMVAMGYHLAYYVDMVDTPAFHADVIAYPAITVIRREKPGPTRIAHRPKIDRDTLIVLTQTLRAKTISKGSGVVEMSSVAKGREPWILQSFDQLAVVRRLESDFPSLEDAGCKVGIGVATGADKVFIGPFDDLDIEPDRKLPLIKTKDIENGIVKWRGQGVINPFGHNGSLVDLKEYPKLARYFKRHEHVIRKRNCAKKNPRGWYRTIDRIYPDLTYRPKLLIPDIKGEAHVVYEEGKCYPHHNLYYITSDEWDLKALQAVLRSGIANLFVSVYSTRMRGGYLRFQAQYLRRIRLPRWKDVPVSISKALVKAVHKGDIEECNQATFNLYRLTPEERSVIGGNGNED